MILVCGMHRSGTSLMMQILQKAGVNVGREDDIQPQKYVDGKPVFSDFKIKDNPLGFFEHAGLSRINRGLLEESRDIPGDVSDLVWDRYSTKAADLMARNTKLEVFKDPRSTLLLPFWNTVLHEGRLGIYGIIKMWRNPLEIGNSLAARGDCDPQTGAKIANEYEECFWRDVNRLDGFPVLVIPYKSLLDCDSWVAGKLEDFLQEALNKKFIIEADFPVQKYLYRNKAVQENGWFKVVN